MPFSIAIDGPSAAGKSTVAKGVAKFLKFNYIDTGAMYRFLAYISIERYKERLGDLVREKGTFEKFLEEEAKKMDFTFKDGIMYVNGKVVGDEIRNNEVSLFAAEIARFSSVREVLVFKQRNLALNYDVVMDGRDIGTYVLPHATLKIFLTAEVNIRAYRRYEELKKNGNKSLAFYKVKEDLILRDKKDMTRKIAPLKKAPDAKVIDTSNKNIDEVISTIVKFFKERVKK